MTYGFHEDIERACTTQQVGIFSVILSNFGNLRAQGFHDDVTLSSEWFGSGNTIALRRVYHWVDPETHETKKYIFTHRINVSSEIERLQ